MKLLLELDDQKLGLVSAPENAPWERLAARAIILDAAGQVALLHATKNGYHKLPGGGIEQDEDWQTALVREAMEEIGCEVKLRPEAVGKIVEYRAKHNLTQTSLCGVADVVRNTGEIDLTEDEIAVGLSVVWMSLDQAIDRLQKDHTDDYEGKFIQARDLTFLNEFKKTIAND